MGNGAHTNTDRGPARAIAGADSLPGNCRPSAYHVSGSSGGIRSNRAVRAKSVGRIVVYPGFQSNRHETPSPSAGGIPQHSICQPVTNTGTVSPAALKDSELLQSVHSHPDHTPSRPPAGATPWTAAERRNPSATLPKLGCPDRLDVGRISDDHLRTTGRGRQPRHV